MPTPSPLRALLYAFLTICVALSLAFYVQAAMMIYDFYQILQWLEGLAQ